VDGSEVKRAYTAMRRFLSPRYVPHKRWDTIWDKAAKLLDREDIPVEKYVEIQFDTVVPFPMPNHLLGDKALARYYKAAPDEYADAVKRFDYEVTHLETRKKFMSVERILSMEPSTLSPVFRYCVANINGLTRLEDELFETAVIQLKRSTVSRKIYREFIPDVLWKAANAGES